jgi:hypothetical protein
VRLRTLGAFAVAVVAVAGLAGCRTNVGTAAMVNGQRITESDVNDLVTHAGVDPKLAAQAAAQQQQIQPPKSQVLTFLIQEKVFEDTLDAEKVKHPEGALNAVHDAAASEFFQTNVSGTDFEATLKQRLPQFGITADFVSTLLRVAELRYLLHVHNPKAPSLMAIINRAKVSVTVSPRYGVWQPSQLSLSPAAPVPGYLSLQPGENAAAQPAG